MKSVVSAMLERLSKAPDSEIISWAAPVASFGDIQSASVATLGINPSNREFVDERGAELTKNQRRFHSLASLQLKGWAEAGRSEIEKIISSCQEYFFRNPYNGWFRRLEPIVGRTGFSYYDRMFPACHIDLLPFATEKKWGTLSTSRRKSLLQANADLLDGLLHSANLELLILNGQSVVSEFESIVGIRLAARRMPSWALPRSSGDDVPGIAYTGTCSTVGGKLLSNPIRILGYNHNIQSSFGVTSEVINRIAKWVEKNA